MLVDIVQHLGHDRARLVLHLVAGRGRQRKAVQPGQKLQQARPRHHIAAIGRGLRTLTLRPEAFHQRLALRPLGRRQAQQIGVAGRACVKAARQARLGGAELFQIPLVQPEHHPLIGAVVLRDAGLVQLHGADEQDVAG